MSHYSTGHLYVKSDVYGFGVVLLEMLTGERALDTHRANGLSSLVEWTRPSLSEKKKLKKIMDTKLREYYPLDAAFQAAQLILKCLASDPKHRPSMEEVLEELIKISAIEMTAKEKKTSIAKHGANRHQDQEQTNNHGASPNHQKHAGAYGGGGTRSAYHL